MANKFEHSKIIEDVVRVLAVEDNPGDLGLVKELLDEAKIGQYQLHGAVRLSSAIEMLRKETFDAVLLDLNLPDSNGFDTFSVIHDIFPRSPIVVLTGSVDEELAIRAINEGAQDYLFKDELTARNLSHAIFFAIQRKRIEDELRNSEERFRTLSEASFEGIVVHLNGRIIDVNKAALEQTGYAREEVLGISVLDFFAPESIEIVKEAIRLSVVGAYQASLLRKNGEILTVQIQAQMIDCNGQSARFATIMDITEQTNARKRIEDLAAKREDERIRLRTILDTLPVGVSIADAEGFITEINENANRILGRKTPMVMSVGESRQCKGWWADTGIRVRPEEWPLAKTINEGRTIIGEVIDIERFDGNRGTILISSAPILNDRRELIGGVVVYQDITKQRELEHEAIGAKERAELYIDLLTHDINNMNTGIAGYLQLVMERGQLEKSESSKIQKSLDILRSSSHLIENVKKIQQIESAGPSQGIIDLGWLLEDVVQELKGPAESGVTINHSIHLKRVVLASELLKDVFTNIIGNAIKHAGGPVTIDVQLSKTFEDGMEYYKVSIEDNGPGIPDEQKDKVFSRLQRGKTRASGVGLGLFLVRRLVEEYHGLVWVEDRIPGNHTKGARFVVLLPVASIGEYE